MTQEGFCVLEAKHAASAYRAHYEEAYILVSKRLGDSNSRTTRMIRSKDSRLQRNILEGEKKVRVGGRTPGFCKSKHTRDIRGSKMKMIPMK